MQSARSDRSGSPDGRARLFNVAALIGGYGFGQGSIFLAQTWLLAHGHLDLLALFGTHFAFAMLGIILVDAGALIILARHAASIERGEESARTMWRVFWETTVFRAGLAVAVIVIGAIGAVFAADPFTTAFAIFAAPAFVLWAVNAGGRLLRPLSLRRPPAPQRKRPRRPACFGRRHRARSRAAGDGPPAGRAGARDGPHRGPLLGRAA